MWSGISNAVEYEECLGKMVRRTGLNSGGCSNVNCVKCVNGAEE